MKRYSAHSTVSESLLDKFEFVESESGQYYRRGDVLDALFEKDARIAALHKNAERYRHFRENLRYEWRNGPRLYWYLPRGLDGTNAQQLDAAVDAAIAEKEQAK